MKRKRLDRDVGWGFQYFPYYQFRIECGSFSGLVCLIDLLDGEIYRWGGYKKAGDPAVSGAGMKWLQLVPDGKSRLVTAMYLPDGKLSVCYIDVIERIEYDPDGTAAYVDKYLDVVFTPQGDLAVYDRDELDEAFAAGDITKEQYDSALKECDDIVSELSGGILEAEKRLGEIFGHVLKMIENGEKPFITKYRNELIERGILK